MVKYNLPNLARVMVEYSNAIDVDLPDFDGREVRDTIQGWANMVAKCTDYESLEVARYQLGLCPDGGGHWGGEMGYCKYYKCPTWEQRDDHELVGNKGFGDN